MVLFWKYSSPPCCIRVIISGFSSGIPAQEKEAEHNQRFMAFQFLCEKSWKSGETQRGTTLI